MSHPTPAIAHTPGPWSIFHYEDGLLAGLNYIAPDDDSESPVVTVCRGESEEEAQANARLIASSPDLLAALEAQERADEAKAEFDLWDETLGDPDSFSWQMLSNQLRRDWDEKREKAKALRAAALSKAKGVTP